MSLQGMETGLGTGRPVELMLFQRSGRRYAYCTDQVPWTYLGYTFAPANITRTEPQQGRTKEGATLTLTLPGSHELAALLRGPYAQGLDLTIYRAHVGEAEIQPWWVGIARGLADKGPRAEITCESLEARLKRKILRRGMTIGCGRALYDDGCTLSPTAHRTSAVLSYVSADGLQVKAAAFAGKPTGNFNAGWIQFGDRTAFVLDHVGDTLTLQSVLPGLAVGIPVDAFDGCDRSKARCTALGNLVNYGGFPWISPKNVFDVGLEG